MPKVLSVNISKEKGTVKQPVEMIHLNATGVEGDAHSGKWHRQVSLLGRESFEKFSVLAGREIAYGEFAENITTDGIILYKTHPLDRFVMGEAELEVTQIGKKCHGDSCAIYREVGNCVMPKEGIFCRVIKPGTVKAGDVFEYHPKTFHIEIITLSDRASTGEYTDRSGPRIRELLDAFFRELGWKYEINNTILPDNPEKLTRELAKCREEKRDFVFTTGGTGVGPRDITPEVTRDMMDKEIPGIMEMIRVKYGAEKPGALLARGVAGLMGNTFVFNLPGSVKAVNEYVPEITRHIRHLVLMLHGIDQH
jgi:molybdenum cofactor synthesis domain-containing protein